MSLTMWLYWIDVLGNLSELFIIIGVALCVLAPPAFVAVFEFGGVEQSRVIKIISAVIGAGLMFITLSVFIPSKQTMHAMLAADAGEKIVQSQEFKEIGGKALEALNKKLDELGGEK